MQLSTKTITVFLIGVMLVITAYYVIQTYIAQQSQSTLTQLELALNNQEVVLLKLSDLTRVNGADAATQRIIIDCADDDRRRFDVLLDTLSGTINPAELSELNTLFYKCGSFFSDRKSVMATRLVREVEIFAEYQSLRNRLKKGTKSEALQLAAWQDLAEAELKTAEYFNKLVNLQGLIITELRAGKSATSLEITNTLSEVNSVRGQMLVLSKQIEDRKKDALTL